MQTLHVQQRAVRTPSDYDGCIDVGMVGVTTTDADEARLALAAPGVNDTTCGTGLGCEPRRDGHDLPASFLHLVGQDRRELMPARVEDHAVEPRLLAHLPAGLGPRAPRRGGHPASVEVFQHGDAEAASDVEGSTVVEVAPDPRLRRAMTFCARRFCASICSKLADRDSSSLVERASVVATPRSMPTLSGSGAGTSCSISQAKAMCQPVASRLMVAFFSAPRIGWASRNLTQP